MFNQFFAKYAMKLALEGAATRDAGRLDLRGHRAGELLPTAGEMLTVTARLDRDDPFPPSTPR